MLYFPITISGLKYNHYILYIQFACNLEILLLFVQLPHSRKKKSYRALILKNLLFCSLLMNGMHPPFRLSLIFSLLS